MASNISVTPGAGATVAADDIGGGLLAQRVKLAVGATGSGTDLAFGQTTKSASLPVTLASDTGTLAINQVSSAYDVALSFSRPADTTAYTGNDVVGGALTFASVGPSAASVMVTGVQLEVDVAAVPSGMTTFRLYLYGVTPPSALADNAVWDLPSGDRASFLGFIDVGTPVDLGSTLYVEVNGVNKQLKLASANLYAYLVTAGAYTPGSADAFKVTVHTTAV
jgi:hypothetical protein